MTIRANTKMPPSQRNTFSLSLSARPPNIAGPGLSLTRAFNVESQPLAELHAEKIDACRLKRAEVQKYIRTARVVLDESEAAIGIPHFQCSGGHLALLPLRLQPHFDRSRRLGLKRRSVRGVYRPAPWWLLRFD